MSRPEEEYADIHAVFAKVRHVPYRMKLAAAEAEIDEFKKAMSVITQTWMAVMLYVTPCTLRYRVGRYETKVPRARGPRRLGKK